MTLTRISLSFAEGTRAYWPKQMLVETLRDPCPRVRQMAAFAMVQLEMTDEMLFHFLHLC
jgi:hypothetical protein